MDETFILNTEDLNEFGFRILTGGIDLKSFKKNPVALWSHIRSGVWSDIKPVDKLPIGNWTEIKKTDGVLTAKLRMDEITDLDQAIVAKVKSGTIRAASIHIRILEWSDNPKHLLQGQRRPTVTKSIMKEGSLVDIPGNAGCVKLSYKGIEIELTGGKDDEEKLNSILPIIQQKNSKMEVLKKHLKLGAEASEADILAAITKLENRNVQLSAKLKEVEDKVAEQAELSAKDKATALVQSAIDQKKITESQKASWEQLALDSYDSAKTALDAMKGFTSLSAQLKPGDKSNTNLDDKAKYDQNWEKGKGQLKAWLNDNPEEFKRCYLAYFGAEYAD